MSEHINTTKQKNDVLEEIVRLILNNESVQSYYLENKEILDSITPFDVFDILHFQESFFVDVEDIKKIAGKLINLFRYGLENYTWEKENTSILMKYLIDEGSIIRKELDNIKPLIKDLNNVDKIKLAVIFDKFSELDKRFIKMENIIFPHLEKNMVNPKPLQIMWSLHDDAKDTLKVLLKQFETNDTNLSQTIGKYYFLIYGILEKEELLVLPIASRVIKKEEWDEMLKESIDYGFSFMDVKEMSENVSKESNNDYKDLLFSSETGGLSLEELLLILNKLPIDFTFVDEFNQVKFFNNTKDRIFPRTPSIIGREVNKCHPPKSVHVVEEIIEHFKSGIKNEAKFWLEIKGHFLVITYYAIRDKLGTYKGVLEVTQDVTDIRSLTGEQRLLNWTK